MDALSDLLVSQIRSLGNFKVMDKGTIHSVLRLEEQKQKLQTCNDQNCFAEFGQALGARYIVVGNVSLFGSTYLLNLKIIDVQKVEMLNGVSKSVEGGEDQLLAIMPSATRELFAGAGSALGIQVPASAADESSWFSIVANGKHRWTLSLEVGAVLFRTSKFTGGDSHILADDVDSGLLANARRGGIDAGGARNGTALPLAVGMGLLRWLQVSLLLGGYIADDANGDWTHRGVELGVETLASLPIDKWWEPILFLSLGYSRKIDTARIEHSIGLPSFDADHGLTGDGLFVNAGIGANLYLMPRWFLGVRAGWSLRYYGNNIKHTINTEPDKLSALGYSEKTTTLDVKEAVNAINLSLSTGFRF
jgi:hypothetical protein